MKRLIAMILVFAVAWSALWLWTSRATLREARALAGDLRAAGWEIDYADLNVRGFPSRLDLTVDEPRVTTPQGAAWRAPFVQHLQLTYQRDRAIIAFADSQTLVLDGTEVRVSDTGLRASLYEGRFTAEAEDMVFDWEGGRLTAGPILAALRPNGEPGRYDLFLEAQHPPPVRRDRDLSRAAC